MKVLPINIDQLIQSVESVRREFKKSWSDPTKEQITRTICAFANDFFNLNDGYIIIGIEEQAGKPILPIAGLEDVNIDQIQKEIRGQCDRIDPAYQPILSPETYQEKSILVIWAPAGDVRPYQAPINLRGKERAYYIRQGSETREAKGGTLTQLLQMTAKVPFDDRRNISAGIEVISPALVRNFLANIKSELVAPGINIPDQEIYRYLRITTPVNSHDVPKNVALLFLSTTQNNFSQGRGLKLSNSAMALEAI